MFEHIGLFNGSEEFCLLRLLLRLLPMISSDHDALLTSLIAVGSVAVGCGAPPTPLFLPHLTPIQYTTYQHICLAVLMVWHEVVAVQRGSLFLSFHPASGASFFAFSPLTAYNLPIFIT